jgi:hypothetical protein
LPNILHAPKGEERCDGEGAVRKKNGMPAESMMQLTSGWSGVS